MEKNNQKGRRSEKELAQAMYDLVLAGQDEEDILEALGIPTQKARSLHYQLAKMGKLTLEQLDFTSSRRILVTERGVFIPRSRFSAVGLDATFPAGTPVRFRKHGNSLVMEPRNTGDMRVQKQAVQPEPPLLAFEDDLIANAIALGEANESNA